jgi:predicted ABC-type ATPase
MTPQKRFRMFAGPNGSGKSSLYNRLRKDSIIHTEIYVAADRIESEFRKKKQFVFNAYRVKITEHEFLSEARNSSILEKHPNKTEVLKSFRIKSGILKIANSTFIDSYVASFIASYLSSKLLESGQSFCFETVMSHESKIDLLREAKRLGFKAYLYFVFTDDPNLNVKRVDLREKAGGHGVAKAKILSRFQRSLDALPDAVRIADESYLVDNSLTIEKAYDVVAQISKGKILVAHKNGYDFKKKLPAFYKAFKKVIK